MIPALCGIIQDLAGSAVLELADYIGVCAGRLSDIQVTGYLNHTQVLVGCNHCLFQCLLLHFFYLLLRESLLCSISPWVYHLTLSLSQKAASCKQNSRQNHDSRNPDEGILPIQSPAFFIFLTDAAVHALKDAGAAL